MRPTLRDKILGLEGSTLGFEDRVWNLARRHWGLLVCGLPLALQVAYLFAVRLWHMKHNSRETVHVDALLLLAFALGGSILLLCWHRKLGKWAPCLAVALSILGSCGVLLQQDRQMQWEGMDVPTENVRAATLASQIGPLKLISTWNARANPRIAEHQYLPHPQELIDRIENLKLTWTIGSRWDTLDLPQDNNRMFLHPPGYPLALGFWMRVLGTSRASATAFDMLIKALLALAACYWGFRFIPRGDSLNRAALSVTVASCPALVTICLPQGNCLAGLLALLGLVLVFREGDPRPFPAWCGAGIFFCLGALTSFLCGLAMVSIWACVLFARPIWRNGSFLGMSCGIALVPLIAAVAGYYPWLTFYTGTHVAHHYRLHYPTTALRSILEWSRCGAPLLVLFCLGGLLIRELHGKTAKLLITGAFLGLVLVTWQTYGLNPGGRYMVSGWFLLTPLYATALVRLGLPLLTTLWIPLANFLYLGLSVFL
jgi:hypothetical protein